MCNAGPEISEDGEGGKERESERAALLCHITSHIGASDEKSIEKQPHQILNSTYLSVSFFMLLFLSFPSIFISVYLFQSVPRYLSQITSLSL